MSFGYLTAVDAIEQRALGGLSLSPQPAAAAWKGLWKGSAATLLVSSWTGPKVALFRTVRLSGEGLEIVNVIGAARAPIDAPILGIDLVAARSDAGVVVADLSPLGPGAQNALLPEWAQGIFSDAPLVERVTPETAAAAIARVMPLVDRFIAAVVAARPSGDAVARREAIERYRAGHLADERMTTMLAQMFGADSARTLMHDVLFPEIEAVHVHA